MSAPHTTLARSRRAKLLGSVDLWNITALLVGAVVFVLLVPPVRSYPVIDDWLYAKAVDQLLHLRYSIPDWAQAISLGHIAWGAIFAAVFDYNFASLGASTLVMSGVCLMALYTLLRHLSVSPPGALLGTAAFGVTTIFVNLSYSFMTDITFLGCLLVGCLCFVRGAQGHSEGWFWAGSTMTAWAYLTRQFGILLVIAILSYLLWKKQLTPRQLLAIIVVPALVALAYYLWSRTQPAPIVTYYMPATAQVPAGKEWLFAFDRLLRLTWVLAVPGLTFLPFIRLRYITLRTLAVFVVLEGLRIVTMLHYGTIFPPVGNLLSMEGFLMLDYNAVPVFSFPAWALLDMAGLFALSCALMGPLGTIGGRLRSLTPAGLKNAWYAVSTGQRPGDEALIVYIFGAMTVVALIVLTPLLLDRYFLPVLPAILVLVLRDSYPDTRAGAVASMALPKPAVAWALASICGLGIFSGLAERDFIDHMSARWTAAQSLVQKGISANRISNGFEWAGWNTYEQGVRTLRAQIRAGEPIDVSVSPVYVAQSPDYIVSDVPVEGYEEIGSVPYRSRLGGFTTRTVLILRRGK